MPTLHLRNSISRSPWRGGFLLIPLALACFALLSRAQAATLELLPAPAPDGFYTGFDTAEGLNALHNVNTAVGVFNTALGFAALKLDTTGAHNTAVGGQALLNNNGSFNTAVGENALVKNTTGSQNMALGQGALANNKTGGVNTAMGYQALNANTTINGQSGNANVAVGTQALFFNTTGFSNTAIGYLALYGNTTGINNIALGVEAGDQISGSSNIDIGNEGVTGDDHTIRIGGPIGVSDPQTATYIAGIYNESAVGGSAVFVTSNGKLGTITAVSSQRFKDEIKPMDKASEAILALKTVTFRYKKELDPDGIPQFGLVAEDVAKVNPALIIRDKEGKPYTVRYEAVNAMLLNEFLKEHRTVQEQKATIAQLKQDFQSRLAEQRKQIEALAAGLQKVSAQVEMSKPAPQTTANNQ